ncbi:RNA exonuclease 1 homolog [Plutella xylostella]|uniref:RNA exonuclease 1 homolog n=1 Tax=Plutella xylostella TaxID=51655 RepID=UPI00203239A1|nr:RNA exonuclease 1 homolog [Plutella xylostella]
MLPSTGYFKGISCPFYDSGLCERPYCHFRHIKKESQGLASDGIESGVILQQLVSEAVKKVLQQTETSNSPSSAASTDNGVTTNGEVIQNHIPAKVTYNPTPIAELKKITNTDTENENNNEQQRKRHIPVPYTPRKPVSLPITRPEIVDSKPFIYIPPPLTYLPGSTEKPTLDPYLPEGGQESKEKYLQGTEIELQEYKPVENKSANKLNYTPSDKSGSKKKLLEYKPVKVNSKNNAPAVTYQPTPRSQVPCFSSDEDEPDPKKLKLTTDLNGLDDLGAEFDILGQILDEEKSKDDKTNADNGKSKEKHKSSKSSKTNDDVNKSKKSSSEKHDKKRSENKERDKSKSHDKEKSDSKSKSSEKKSSHSHKSSSKDKEKNKDKESSDKKRHSSSKSSDKVSKSSSRSSSKEVHSKHSSSKSSTKDKNHKHSDRKSSEKKVKEKDKSKEKKIKEKPETVVLPSDQEDFDDRNNFSDELCEELSESDEEAIALECKKIFEEYVPSVKTKIAEEMPSKEDNNSDEYIPSKKRVSHTIDKNIKITPKEPIKPDYKVSAAQKMAERLPKVREYHAAKKAEAVSASTEMMKSSFTPPVSSGKIRIAHVPYASTLMNAKRVMPPKIEVKPEPSTSTITQTVKKGVSRVAHMPNEKFIDRPGVLEPLASKIPANIRSTYLNMMIDECIKIYLSHTDAYARAQHEELATSKKCKTIQIYKNSAVLAVSRLRKELLECNGVKKTGSDCTTLQRIPSAISGTSGSAGSWSIENKNKRNFENPKEFTGAKFYANISKWILTEEQLQDNGFPRVHPNGTKGRAMIYAENKKQKPPKGIFRTCTRCKKEYTVDKRNFPAVKEECIYHPNNKYRFRGEVRYQCCSQDGTSDGCCVAPYHVYEYVDYENLKGYIRTLPPEREMEDYGIYSLDCEMCYTTNGLDLTRITVIDASCKVIYETLVKPLHPIIDYNTRYSGITEEQMTGVRTTLLDVQATLLTMFNSKTILIGHSLESDFKALKLIHDTVIDTSVLFPHKMGPPYKRALRNLSSEYLKKIIQNSVEGHDSAEDATVCMELLHYKLKEDLKTR